MIPKTCDGCEKPFNAVRKLRRISYQAFQSTAPSSFGRTGIAPVHLCGACSAFVERGGRPFDLPGLERRIRDLETVVLADNAGQIQ